MEKSLLKLIYNDELISEYAEYQGEIIKHNLKLGYLAQELLRIKRKRFMNFALKYLHFMI